MLLIEPCADRCPALLIMICCPTSTGLPPGKPRYVMGIGYPLDIVVCSALGADM